MERRDGRDQPEAESEPNFELPNRGAISEDNWEEYKALGFDVLHSAVSEEALAGKLQTSEGTYGATNVFTGDAFDEDADRPLRHKPGVGVYISPAGEEFSRQQDEEWRAYRDKATQEQDDTGPAAR